MSVHNLHPQPTLHNDTRTPTVADIMDASRMKLTMGKQWNKDEEAFHIGFVSPATPWNPMGSISENAKTVDGKLLTILQCSAHTDNIVAEFEQVKVFDADSITLILGFETFTLLWYDADKLYSTNGVPDNRFSRLDHFVGVSIELNVTL